MTILQPVLRQMQIDNGGLAITIAMCGTRWGARDVLTAPTCAGCGWHHRGRTYVD
jgi:hypothetical protein